MPSDHVLEVNDLTKTFRLFAGPRARLLHALSGGRCGGGRIHTAVSGVSFCLAAGETLGIMGRNGAGKTTLLHLLAGSLRPTSGVLRRPARVGTLIALGAGFDPEDTGLNNLRLWGAMHDDGPFTRDELKWIADFTELGEALDRPVRTYSQGMQLRLGFAVAAARRPDLLIMDEVMAVGDFFFRSKCHALIRQHVARGTAAVLVSHDYTEILQFCKTAIVLADGRAIFQGPTSTAVNRYLHSHSGLERSHAENHAVDAPSNSSLGFTWPEMNECLDASGLGADNMHGIAINRLACCNASLRQQWVFSQGEFASFYVEAQAKCDLEVLIVSFILTDERGVIIHGSSSHMRGDAPARRLRQGRRTSVRCDIGLALRYGEYRLDISFSHCPMQTFKRRSEFAFDELGAEITQLGRLESVGVIAVVPRQGGTPTQLTHHGMCDLPGRITSIIE